MYGSDGSGDDIRYPIPVHSPIKDDSRKLLSMDVNSPSMNDSGPSGKRLRALTPTLAPPTQVRELVATEDAGGMLVSWQEPFDTGYGDTTARVDYVVESSLCPDFAHHDLECIYHSQVVSGSITNSDYPSFHLRLGKDVLEVEADIYHIRVTALNEAGAGASRETNQRYMMNVTALTAVQIGQDLEVKWRYGVLDQPNLKVVVKVWSDHDFMASYDFTVSDMTCQTPSRPLDCGSGFTDPFRCEECQLHAYKDDCGGVCDSATTCNANGRCNGRTGECECYDGWSGADCTVPKFNVIDKACRVGTSGVTCSRCEDNMYLEECTEGCDMVTTCNANGRCSGRTGLCTCFDGWVGSDCSTWVGQNIETGQNYDLGVVDACMCTHDDVTTCNSQECLSGFIDYCRLLVQ